MVILARAIILILGLMLIAAGLFSRPAVRERILDAGKELLEGSPEKPLTPSRYRRLAMWLLQRLYRVAQRLSSGRC